MAKDAQILKSRDDKNPIRLIKDADGNDPSKPYRLSEGGESSWLKPDTAAGPAELRPRIEPWLTALFQSEHLGLLIGSGLPQAVHRLATGNALPGMNSAKFTQFENEISKVAKDSAKAAGRVASDFPCPGDSISESGSPSWTRSDSCCV